ncbi:acetyl-CoA acetyltransferase [Marinomonas phage CB5A]|uniref:Uncharacterized protein n=3 Tax=Murciavirus TaxID=2731675 RepID=A0A1W5SAC5_9CAUD|nr:acetyl-CoA acetyltransferase [Marinomonas phage CPP1m]YP_009791137.1 acetyl-CoA acetyltransferase [Marinomonas phage CB5A]ARB11263.1 hypothetical protein [Marinomonas phage CPP1m]ARB11313.1 hypothetical protein [Marinomonas phage CPG1g]ASP46290.1 hypothetical protein [Marinomonas phage CB5A]
MTTPLTGDIYTLQAKKKYGVTLQNFPTVPAAELADVDSIVNASAQSGKRLGGQLMAVTYTGEDVTTAALYVASGSAPTDPWIMATQVVGTGSADVTPA